MARVMLACAVGVVGLSVQVRDSLAWTFSKLPSIGLVQLLEQAKDLAAQLTENLRRPRAKDERFVQQYQRVE